MREKFIQWRPHTGTLMLVNKIRRIVGDDDLRNPAVEHDAWTLRQLFEALVREGVLTSSGKDYERLTDAAMNARLAGDLDWNAISDGPSRMLGEEGSSDVEVWIDREALAPQVLAAAAPWGCPVVFYRANPSIDAIYRLHLRGSSVIHFRGPTSAVDLEDRLAVFGGGVVTVFSEELDAYSPQDLRELVADTLVSECGLPPVFFDRKTPYGDARLAEKRWNQVKEIQVAMLDTADTTRALALKKKIEAILNG